MSNVQGTLNAAEVFDLADGLTFNLELQDFEYVGRKRIRQTKRDKLGQGLRVIMRQVAAGMFVYFVCHALLFVLCTHAGKDARVPTE